MYVHTHTHTCTHTHRLDDVDEARDVLEQLCEDEGRDVPFLQVQRECVLLDRICSLTALYEQLCEDEGRDVAFLQVPLTA